MNNEDWLYGKIVKSCLPGNKIVLNKMSNTFKQHWVVRDHLILNVKAQIGRESYAL